MRILTNEIYITDKPLTYNQERQILASPNAMSAFAYDYAKCATDPTRLPPSYYFPVYTIFSDFLGAVHMETEQNSTAINIHPMLIERHRLRFSQATELAIIFCLVRNRTPYARVKNIPEYAYMHEFLNSLDIPFTVDGEWRTYGLMDGSWIPKSFSSYRVEVR